jgi:hypothetical protein
MTRVRLYIDEDAADRIIVDGLAAAGIDVLTTEQGSGNQATDESQLRFAIESGRAIYSLNVRDFSRLHAETLARGGEHFGIILIPRQRYTSKEKLRRLISVLEATTAEGLRNQILYL